MPKRRRSKVTAATLAAKFEAIDAIPIERAPITRGTVGTVAPLRSPHARKRSTLVKGGSVDGTVRVRRADGTVEIFRPAIDRDRRKPSAIDRDPIHPLRGALGVHPVTGAPVAREGFPVTAGLGDYPDDDPPDLPPADAYHASLPRTDGNSTARLRERR